MPTLLEKYDLPITSKILLGVTVAFAPMMSTCDVSVGWMASESVVVDHAVAPPPPPEVTSVPHCGTPPWTLRTVPGPPTGRRASENVVSA